MNRNEALNFIKDNSRVIRSFHLNPEPKNQRDEDYKPQYLEQRIGNNGTTFCLLDMAEHGWDLYLHDGTNEISKSISLFCEATGAKITEPIK